jgi:hypothetical protein
METPSNKGQKEINLPNPDIDIGEMSNILYPNNPILKNVRG